MNPELKKFVREHKHKSLSSLDQTFGSIKGYSKERTLTAVLKEQNRWNPTKFIEDEYISIQMKRNSINPSQDQNVFQTNIIQRLDPDLYPLQNKRSSLPSLKKIVEEKKKDINRWEPKFRKKKTVQIAYIPDMYSNVQMRS